MLYINEGLYLLCSVLILAGVLGNAEDLNKKKAVF